MFVKKLSNPLLLKLILKSQNVQSNNKSNELDRKYVPKSIVIYK